MVSAWPERELVPGVALGAVRSAEACDFMFRLGNRRGGADDDHERSRVRDEDVGASAGLHGRLLAALLADQPAAYAFLIVQIGPHMPHVAHGGGDELLDAIWNRLRSRILRRL